MIVALVPVSPIVDAARAAKQEREAVGAGDVAQQHRGRQHGGVADAVDREHAKRIRHRRRPLVKERDEQRRAEADELPPDEEDRDVAGQRHQQHAGDEHREQDEVAVVAGLPVQISIRKRRHDAGDGRRERRERRARVDRRGIRSRCRPRATPTRRRTRAAACRFRSFRTRRAPPTSAAHAIVIELPASEPVHRSGSGRLTSDAPPSSASRTAGDPTPTSTSHVRGTLAVMPMARLRRASVRRRGGPARSPPEEGTRACPDTTRPIRPRPPPGHVRACAARSRSTRSSHKAPDSASRQASQIQRFRTSRSMSGLPCTTRQRRSARAFHDDRQSRGLVDLDHLPGKAGAQIALRAVHHAQQRGDVVRQLGAAAVSGRIDVAEVVLEADAGDDGHDGRHDAREDRAIVVARRIVRDQKRAPIEEQPARPRPPADDAERVGGMAVLGPRLRQIGGASLHVGQRRQRRIPARDAHRTGGTVRAPRAASSSRSPPWPARTAAGTPQG